MLKIILTRYMLNIYVDMVQCCHNLSLRINNLPFTYKTF